MCLICDGYSYEEVHRGIELTILTNGWAVQGVAPGPGEDPGGASWAYTIGLTENFGVPELVVTDVEYEAAGALLNWACRRLADGDSPDDLADDHVGWATVAQKHLEGELFDGWASYYDRSPGDAEFLQLIPPPEFYCEYCQSKGRADLSDPFEQFPLNRP